MLGRRNGRSYECVIIDLNTQRDFCDPNGLYPVANLEQLVPALRHVVEWAGQNEAPVISSLESHRQWELPRGGLPLLCCIDGTVGQRKVEFTLFANRVCVEADNTLAVPFDLFSDCQQVIFRKRTEDLLANPKADRFLTHLAVDEYLILGNCLESAVKAVTLGLLARNKRVTVVLDACGYWDLATADLAVRQISAKGARILNVEDLVKRTLERRYRCTAYEAYGNGNGHANGNGNGNGNGKANGNGHTKQNGRYGSDADFNGDELRGLLENFTDPRMLE